jgi:hypothetical protein
MVPSGAFLRSRWTVLLQTLRSASEVRGHEISLGRSQKMRYTSLELFTRSISFQSLAVNVLGVIDLMCHFVVGLLIVVSSSQIRVRIPESL